MACNPNITWEIIQANLDKPWDWNWISDNPNITWEIIQQNPDKPWDWSMISQNPNITWEIIQQNPDKSWNWDWMACNPNITWEFIQANPDKPWDGYGISKNKMELDKQRWINKRRLEHIKALQIQRHWRNCSCNPEFKLAQRYLLRLYI